ncbi:MAG: CHASE2 domain-containing protein [Leptolyngbyaceae cyanobacterium bins.349]|nr:CHASE2 domain-containing protein [Leptolyngbyaceae cyanobacterium bins.349]
MRRIPWNSLKTTLTTWRDWGFPGAIVIGLVVAARLTGSLQGLELVALDTFLRLRPTESPDDRIVLIGFDDVEKTEYPISEQKIVNLINQLQTYQPKVIGLHIQQNQVAGSGNQLFSRLKQYQNLIVTGVVLGAADQIPAPAGFPENQTGFVDITYDEDNRVRRLSLGLNDPIKIKKYNWSLAIRLTEQYLVSIDSSLILNNGIRDPDTMRFGSIEIPRLLHDSGGYVDVDVGNPELLLNFRNGDQPFQLFSVADLESGKLNANQLRDRIVIVGITDPIIRSTIPTAATTEINSIQIQAHAVSQIISAVLDDRALIDTWTDTWEYVWIVSWGILAMIWGHTSFSNRVKLAGIGLVQVGVIGISYFALVFGWWIPIVPVSLAWLINSLGYTAFYKYDWVLRSRLKENQRLVEERQRLIEQIFNVIHNGPLQTLASAMRQLRDQEIPQTQLVQILENLNTEMRQIGEHAKQEIMLEERSLYLRDGIKLDLQLPIDELLYEVYSYTLDRPEFSRFQSLKVSYDFEPIEQPILSIEQRQSLCRFLEEALCNVAKHADKATHLTVTSTYKNGWYTVQVLDDGIGIRSTREGEGTQYARRVATQLRGKFKREGLIPKGTLCQLSLPLVKSWWW